MGGDTPEARDPVDDYRRGLELYRSVFPQMLQDEHDARVGQDPARIEHQMALERQFDPERVRIRNALGANIREDMANGYEIPDALNTQLQQNFRGGQAARGNILGNSAANAEATFTAGTAYDMYNRRMANAGTFLSMPSPSTPDRSAAYTIGANSAGPLGVSFGAQQYQQQLQAQQAGGNSWAGALAGGASGAATGAAMGSVVPGLGTAWGAVIGGAAGAASGYFSSVTEKENIEHLGTSGMGLPVIRYNYKWLPGRRFIGTIAEEVMKIVPSAVTKVGNRLLVNYDDIDVVFQEVV